jgi:hypothetical protein
MGLFGFHARIPSGKVASKVNVRTGLVCIIDINFAGKVCGRGDEMPDQMGLQRRRSASKFSPASPNSYSGMSTFETIV